MPFQSHPTKENVNHRDEKLLDEEVQFYAPTSFSGPPLNMHSPIPYDVDELLPHVEPTRIQLQHHKLHSQRIDDDCDTIKLNQTPRIALRSLPTSQPSPPSQSLDCLPPATMPNTPTTLAPTHTPCPLIDHRTPRLCEHHIRPSTSPSPSSTMALSSHTSSSASRQQTPLALTTRRGFLEAFFTTTSPSTIHQSSSTVRPHTSASSSSSSHSCKDGVDDSLQLTLRASTARVSHRQKIASRTSSPHRAFLALQSHQVDQSSTITNHDTGLGTFRRRPFLVTSENGNFDDPEWSHSSEVGRQVARAESIARVDAIIRARIDEVTRAKAQQHLNVLETLYTDARGAFDQLKQIPPHLLLPSSPCSPSTASSRSPRKSPLPPSSTSPRPPSSHSFTRTLFDPSVRMARVRKAHQQAMRANESLKRAMEERSEEQQRARLEYERQQLELDRANRAERQRIHQLYERLKSDREARKEREREEKESQELERIQRAEREFERCQEYIRQHSSALAAAGLKTRSQRQAELVEIEAVRQRKEDERWHRLQVEWKMAQDEVMAKKQDRLAKEQQLKEEADEEKRQHAAKARKERDQRIMRHILSLQHQSRQESSEEERTRQRLDRLESRQRAAHMNHRDTLASIGRAKLLAKRQAKAEEESRHRQLQQDKAAALKRLASKGYRETIRANLSPKRSKTNNKTDSNLSQQEEEGQSNLNTNQSDPIVTLNKTDPPPESANP